MKFIQKLQKFMYGRYGVDDLFKFSFFIYVILVILNMFLNNLIINIAKLLLLFIIFYRYLSKNIYKRSNENRKFLKIKKKIFSPFNNIKRNINDKDHVYKRCHKCKKTIKLPLPRKKGIKHAKCPHCGKRNTIFTLKYQKIEFIK
jgi:translation initiation factor 2 beta subunit (eIF-2beta)/eIF-5